MGRRAQRVGPGGLGPAERAARRARRQARAMGQAKAALAPAIPSRAFAVYRDIPIAPSRSFRLQSILTDGGPLWPDFDSQTISRFWRRGRMVDAPAAPVEGPFERIDEPCVWGGYAIHHFGHLVADHLTRVLTARVERPKDTMLFLARPGEDGKGSPGYFWDVLAWLGVPLERVRFVAQPMQVAELRCYAQAEPYASWPPDADYLALLERNAADRGLMPERLELAYVGRGGLLAQGKGGAAGESYLIALLTRLGLRVLDPARESLSAQLAVYAGARRLIFAEGSAQHGRQLLGRLDQQIEVLNRRADRRVAEAALAARCTGLTYVPAVSETVSMGTLAAKALPALGLALYDLPALFATFARNGVELGRHWDPEAYRAAQVADAEAWLTASANSGGTTGLDLAMARQRLKDLGVNVVGK